MYRDIYRRRGRGGCTYKCRCRYKYNCRIPDEETNFG